ncbi:MAG TPA: gliding motility-associated C-terminal domain-containing protein [Bacteroidia bacterium]|nr:gliding motility-associated C-terminal domain-containing protein [Bacteroidia bacterium]
MKKLISFIFLITFINNYHSQTIFWTETFGTGCNQGQVANGTVATPTNGAWVVNSTGTNDPFANEWFISATEAGMGAGNCGNGCLNNAGFTNSTLHVGDIIIGDQGAAYAEGGCGFGICTSTNKRAESPTINCTGYSNITLSFEYIQQGTPGSDYTELMYFDGTSWNSLGNLPQTNNSPCVNQGYWTNYNIILPASANNNPNIKIGFRWQNIDDGVATDPSFAVDNIQLSAPTSVLNVTLTVSSNTVCANGTITATANTGTSSVTGYTWSSNPSGASFSPTTGSVTTVSFASAGTYSVNVLVTDGTNTASATQVVTVSPNPTITISSTGNTICPNGNTTLTANGANNYTWAPPGSLSSSTGSAVVASPTINTTYTVSGTNAFGCPSTATVNVVIGPPFTITVTPSSATTCVGGSSVSITAMGNGAYGAINYNWAPSSGLNVTTGPLVSASPSATTTYTVIGSAGSCTAMATTTVNVTPPPPFTVTPTNTVLCQGSSTTYTATGLSTYTWSPAFTLSSNTGSVVTANPTVTTTYTVTGRDNNGCLANPQIITLTVVPVPTATAVLTTPLGNDSICGNTTGTLSVNTSTPPTGFAYNYTWTAPPSYTNTFIVPPNFQQVAILPPVPNPTAVIVYSVQVAYSTLSTCISAPSTVTVYVINCNPPVASFTTIPGNDTLCTGECIVLMNTSTGGQPQTIQWQVPGAIPNTATGDFPQFCFPVPGNYTVFIKVTNNWGADSTVIPNYIHVVDTPNVIGIRDTSINFGDCVTLYGTQASYYSWTGPDGLICNPCTSITPCVYETTNYFVTGYNSKRCKNTDTVTVRIKSDCGEMFIPSAFSPNSDGKNDILYVRGRCLKNFTLQIFNRWGELVFETSDKNVGWDGTQNGQPLNTGVFVYKLEGTTYDNKQYIQKGHITLLR